MTSAKPYHQERHDPLISYMPTSSRQWLDITLKLLIAVAFLALMAQVRLDIGPVPLTGQTLAVLLIASLYGLRLGTLSILLYLLIGLLGLPVFASASAGLATFKGLTGGYLIGFVAAGLVVGYLAQHHWHKRFIPSILSMLLGNAIIYIFGLLWLKRFIQSWETTLHAGLYPFVIGDLLKIFIVALLLPWLWGVVNRSKH
ncbi:MAG: biotin transporter BioY [Deinococcales bacterium]